MKSYLENRYQRVILDDGQHKSSWGVIKHGVSQGSILRSLLLLLYINDLPKCTHNIDNSNKTKIILLADDINLPSTQNILSFSKILK